MGGQACINSPGSPASTSKADVLMDQGLRPKGPSWASTTSRPGRSFCQDRQTGRLSSRHRTK